MNKIIIYFSYSGHTREIANKIKEKLNCDILELEPVIPYSKDYNKVVEEEQNNSSNNKTIPIKKLGIDLSNYDEIILGSPVWWYTITPVIRTFLKENDLSNKTIYPFATNAGWLGHTSQEITKLCPNSKVMELMNILYSEEGDTLKTDPKLINNWINTL